MSKTLLRVTERTEKVGPAEQKGVLMKIDYCLGVESRHDGNGIREVTFSFRLAAWQLACFIPGFRTAALYLRNPKYADGSDYRSHRLDEHVAQEPS